MAKKQQKATEADAWEWTSQKERAAQLLAEDELTDDEIGRLVKINRVQLWRWKKAPEFVARLREIVAAVGVVALRYSIAKRARRVRALDQRWHKMQDVIEARAKDKEHKKAPGGKTGLLVRKIKSVGAGDAAHEVEEFEVDTGLLKELREHEKQAAQELGQWVEKMAPTNPDGTDEYDAGTFGPDETLAILERLVARLGLTPPEPARVESAHPG